MDNVVEDCIDLFSAPIFTILNKRFATNILLKMALNNNQSINHSYLPVHWKVTFKYLYVPRQGSPYRSLFALTWHDFLFSQRCRIMDRALSSRHCSVFIWSEGHVASSVLPYTADIIWIDVLHAMRDGPFPSQTIIIEVLPIEIKQDKVFLNISIHLQVKHMFWNLRFGSDLTTVRWAINMCTKLKVKSNIRIYHGIYVTWLTRCVSLVEQAFCNLPEHPWFIVGFVLLNL
jgi:hypothetical protein